VCQPAPSSPSDPYFLFCSFESFIYRYQLQSQYFSRVGYFSDVTRFHRHDTFSHSDLLFTPPAAEFLGQEESPLWTAKMAKVFLASDPDRFVEVDDPGIVLADICAAFGADVHGAYICRAHDRHIAVTMPDEPLPNCNPSMEYVLHTAGGTMAVNGTAAAASTSAAAIAGPSSVHQAAGHHSAISATEVTAADDEAAVLRHLSRTGMLAVLAASRAMETRAAAASDILPALDENAHVAQKHLGLAMAAYGAGAYCPFTTVRRNVNAADFSWRTG
jgi:hypothetical protein